MTPGVVWAFADQDVEELVRLMEDRKIRRVPVLNREKRLVGIVALGDIAISSNPAFSGMALRDVSEPREPNARQRRLAARSQPPATIESKRLKPLRQTSAGAIGRRTSVRGSSASSPPFVRIIRICRFTNTNVANVRPIPRLSRKSATSRSRSA
jgi:hypothetical protein